MKSNYLRKLIPVIFALVLLAAVLIYLVYVNRQSRNGELAASGTVEAVQVQIAAELGGRVANVLVEEGQQVESGAALLNIDDELYQAQKQRAQAALALAQANLEAAQSAKAITLASVEAAQVQYALALSTARLQSLPERRGQWKETLPDEIVLPVWYFEAGEEIAAAQEEVQASLSALEKEQEYFDTLTADLGNTDFVDAETRLAEAQATFLVAQDVLDQAVAQTDDDIEEHAQSLYDAALAELNAAQTQYDQILTAKSAQDVSEARARLAVARQRYDIAQDRLDFLLSDENALSVRAAQAAVDQAEAALAQADTSILQAQRSVEQAQAEIDLVDVQISKLTLYAPLSGVVMTRNVETGEVVQPAAVLMTIGQLDDLTITVYIAEDRYGEIALGQPAQVRADSFPGEVFDAVVVQIAEQAEYTPRNVQTEEGRRTTVFAIKLVVTDPQNKLKPGMPADVMFEK